jgi:nucleotide-binding universal stress UspA family protein
MVGKVLFAVDGSVPSRDAAAVAHDLLPKAGEILILRIVPQLPYAWNTWPAFPDLSQDLAKAWAYVSEVGGDLEAQGWNVRTRVDPSPLGAAEIDQEILRLVDLLQPNLVCLALARGRVAASIVRKALTPVLVARVSSRDDDARGLREEQNAHVLLHVDCLRPRHRGGLHGDQPARPVLPRGVGLGAIAGTAIVVGAVGNAAGRILSGWMSDTMGRLNVLRLMIAVSAVAMPLVYLAGGNAALLFILVFAIYWCYGTQLSVNASTTSDFWGTKNAGLNYGLLFTAWGVAGIIGPRIAGTLFDRYQNYQAAFFWAAALAVVALIFEFLAKRPAVPAGAPVKATA